MSHRYVYATQEFDPKFFFGPIGFWTPTCGIAVCDDGRVSHNLNWSIPVRAPGSTMLDSRLPTVEHRGYAWLSTLN